MHRAFAQTWECNYIVIHVLPVCVVLILTEREVLPKKKVANKKCRFKARVPMRAAECCVSWGRLFNRCGHNDRCILNMLTTAVKYISERRFVYDKIFQVDVVIISTGGILWELESGIQ